MRSRGPPRSESDERRRRGGADVLYHLQVLLLSRGVTIGAGAGDAQWPSPLSARPSVRPEPWREARELARERQRDPGPRDRSSTTARRPSRRSSSSATAARASCSSRPSRVAWAATRSSASGRARCCAGTTACSTNGPTGAGRRTRAADGRSTIRIGAVSEYLGRYRVAAGRRPAALRGRRGRASSATTWSAPSSRWASPTRTRSACRTWR